MAALPNTDAEFQPTTHLEWALHYAEMGLAVFPVWGINEANKCECGNIPACENGDNAGKHPITPRGLLDATTQAVKIKVWWTKFPNANIGVACGERSGIVVLDIDGSDGFKSLDGKPMPPTPQVSTGRLDGGVHHWFKYPGHKVKNSVKKVGPGLDIRADGGYVILPPSNHKAGTNYAWTSPFNGLDTLPDMPDWLKAATADGNSNQYDPEQDNGEPVVKGSRNVYLTSLAGVYRKRGASFAEIHSALRVRNAERCQPPLDETEVERIAMSISQKPYSTQDEPIIRAVIFDELLGDVEANESCRIAAPNEVGHAETFASLYGNIFRYDHTKKKWMVWFDETGVWREDDSNHAWRGMIATLRLRQSVVPTIRDDTERQTLAKSLEKAQNGSGIANALKHAASLSGLGMRTRDFDGHPYLLNCLNGTLDLTTLEFRPAKRTDYLTRQTNVNYDESAQCPRWEEFIHQVFDNPELEAYVQRALGYCLAGDVSEHAFFIAYGLGGNGKSVMLNTVRKAIGDYGAVTPFNTFDADNRNQYGNDLAALKGRRFVTAIEAEQSRRLAEARVKTVTGGDTLSCRFLYGEFFEFTPEFKVWLAVNHKPIIRGSDNGIWRRIHLIPFLKTFVGDAMDKQLDAKLAAELPGILNWLIDGFQAWQRDGLNPPQIVMDATREYKRENDFVQAWLDENCVLESGASISATDAYTDFKQYIKDTGEQERLTPSMRAWGFSMADKGFEKGRDKGNGRTIYFGLKFKESGSVGKA